MSRRVEVLPGPGLVIRFGEVIAWVGQHASSSLVTFLIDGARNLADDPNGGQLLADHLRGVLVNGDPEPAVPFVTIGPSATGLDLLLHGPVQLWDGTRWHMVSPTPGWLRQRLPTIGTLLTGPAGSQPPSLSISSPLNLVTGVVPGGGLAMIPTPTPPPAPPPGVAAPGPATEPSPATGATTGPTPTTGPQVPLYPAEPRSPFAPPETPESHQPDDAHASPTESSQPAERRESTDPRSSEPPRPQPPDNF